MLTIESAARITAIIVAIGFFISSAQLLLSVKAYIAGGMFDWNSARVRSTSRRGVRRLLTGRSGTIWLRAALIVRAICSLALIAPFQSDRLYGISALLILLTSLFLAYQIRSGKDGSNQISIIIIAGLAFTYLMPAGSPFRPLGLYFIAAQALFSYFAAGLSKLASSPWRAGSAFQTIVNTATYGQRRAAAIVNRSPWVGSLVGWSVLSVEIVFPVAIVSPMGALIALLCAGAMLHLGTAAVIGLDTFVWAFTATFPAIIFAHDALAGLHN